MNLLPDSLSIGIATVVIGEVVAMQVADDSPDEHGRVRWDRLQAVGRLAGGAYVSTDALFDMEDEGLFPGSPQLEVAAS